MPIIATPVKHKTMFCDNVAGGFILGVILSSAVFMLASSACSRQEIKNLGENKDAEITPKKHATAPDISMGDEIAPDDRNGPEERERRREDREIETLRWTKKDVTYAIVFSACLAGVAVFQVILMFMQSHYMKEEMRATKDCANAAIATVEQMRLEQRAWIGFDDVSMAPIDVEKMSCPVFVAKNYGRTPGTIVRQVVHFAVGPNNDLFADFFAVQMGAILEKQSTQEYVLGPGAILNMRDAEGDIPCDAQKTQRVVDGSFALYVFIRIQYLDLLGETRMSQCCYKYEHKAKELFAFKKFNYMT
jgi:hypothetical protein